MGGKRTTKTAEGADPPMVTVSLGATIPTGEFGNVRPHIEIRNIRLDQDLQAQLAPALEAAGVIWLAIDGEIEHRVMDMLSITAGDSTQTVRERIEKLEAWRGRVNRALDRVVEEVKKHKAKLNPEEKTGDEVELNPGS